MPDSFDGNAAQTRKIIDQMMAAMDDRNERNVNFVSREEMARELNALERRIEGRIDSLGSTIGTRFENSELKMRNWVMSGMIASAIMFGGGFISLYTKLDRAAEQTGEITSALDSRRAWIDETDERDRRQDAAIEKVLPTYTPLPFEARPR